MQKSNFRLCLPELGVLGFQYSKHIFWLHPFSHFLIHSKIKASWENNFYTLIWRKTLELYSTFMSPVHVSPEHLLTAEVCAAPAVVLGTWIFTYKLLGGHAFISLVACRSGENTAELWCSCAGLFICSCQSRVTSLMCLLVVCESQSASVHPHRFLLTGGWDHCTDCFSVYIMHLDMRRPQCSWGGQRALVGVVSFLPRLPTLELNSGWGWGSGSVAEPAPNCCGSGSLIPGSYSFLQLSSADALPIFTSF